MQVWRLACIGARIFSEIADYNRLGTRGVHDQYLATTLEGFVCARWGGISWYIGMNVGATTTQRRSSLRRVISLSTMRQLLSE